MPTALYGLIAGRISSTWPGHSRGLVIGNMDHTKSPPYTEHMITKMFFSCGDLLGPIFVGGGLTWNEVTEYFELETIPFHFIQTHHDNVLEDSDFRIRDDMAPLAQQIKHIIKTPPGTVSALPSAAALNIDDFYIGGKHTPAEGKYTYIYSEVILPQDEPLYFPPMLEFEKLGAQERKEKLMMAKTYSPMAETTHLNYTWWRRQLPAVKKTYGSPQPPIVKTPAPQVGGGALTKEKVAEELIQSEDLQRKIDQEKGMQIVVTPPDVFLTSKTFVFAFNMTLAMI